MTLSEIGNSLKHGLFMLAELPMGVLYFTIAVTGLSLSAGLMPVFVGFPLFVALMGFARIFTKLEYTRCYALLKQMPGPFRPSSASDSPRGFWNRFLQALVNLEGWKGIALMLLKLPLGIIVFTVTIVLFSLSLGLLALPIVYYILIESISVDIYEDNVLALFTDLDPLQSSVIYFGIGVLFSYGVVRIVPAISRTYLKITLQLLHL